MGLLYRLERTFTIFSLLFSLIFSTFLISYFNFGPQNIENSLVQTLTTVYLYITYGLIFLMIIYFIFRTGEKNDFGMIKSVFAKVLKILLLITILCFYLYMGGLLIYTNSELFTTSSDKKWIEASISYWGVSLFLFLVWFSLKMYYKTKKQ
jgi:hypothetical protein